MRINLREVLKDYEGKEVKDPKGDLFTVGDTIGLSLNTWLQEELPTAEDKGKVYQLSLKTYGHKESDFTVNELAFIKERVGKVCSALIYGRICDLFDKPTPVTESPKK